MVDLEIERHPAQLELQSAQEASYWRLFATHPHAEEQRLSALRIQHKTSGQQTVFRVDQRLGNGQTESSNRSYLASDAGFLLDQNVSAAYLPVFDRYEWFFIDSATQAFRQPLRHGLLGKWRDAARTHALIERANGRRQTIAQCPNLDHDANSGGACRYCAAFR